MIQSLHVYKYVHLSTFLGSFGVDLKRDWALIRGRVCLCILDLLPSHLCLYRIVARDLIALRRQLRAVAHAHTSPFARWTPLPSCTSDFFAEICGILFLLQLCSCERDESTRGQSDEEGGGSLGVNTTQYNRMNTQSISYLVFHTTVLRFSLVTATDSKQANTQLRERTG